MGAEPITQWTCLNDANAIADGLRLTTRAFGALFGVTNAAASFWLSGKRPPSGPSAHLMAYISCAVRRASESQLAEMRRCVLSYPANSAEALAALLDLCAVVRAKTLATLPARLEVREVKPGKRKTGIPKESRPLPASLWVPKEGVVDGDSSVNSDGSEGAP